MESQQPIRLCVSTEPSVYPFKEMQSKPNSRRFAYLFKMSLVCLDVLHTRNGVPFNSRKPFVNFLKMTF